MRSLSPSLCWVVCLSKQVNHRSRRTTGHVSMNGNLRECNRQREAVVMRSARAAGRERSLLSIGLGGNRRWWLFYMDSTAFQLFRRLQLAIVAKAPP